MAELEACNKDDDDTAIDRALKHNHTLFHHSLALFSAIAIAIYPFIVIYPFTFNVTSLYNHNSCLWDDTDHTCCSHKGSNKDAYMTLDLSLPQGRDG